LVEENISVEQPVARWFIDLDWFPQNGRSFSALAWERLCPACRQRLTAPPGFIHGGLPVLESVFRLFLANGNQPLDLEELSWELSEQRAGGGYRTSPQVLSRLLENDRYYGLGRFEG
jgi:hypothetical protein